MFKISMSSVAGACAVAMCLLSSGVSHAGTPGATGFAFPFTDQTCFAFADAAAVVNNCSTQKQWIVSDTITATGNHSILVTGLRPNGGQLTCSACATTKEGMVANCTVPVSLSTVDSHTQFSIGTVNVPAFGALYVECGLSTGARFDSVSF